MATEAQTVHRTGAAPLDRLALDVDFGVTLAVDGNWDVHAGIRNAIFAGGDS